MGSFQIVLFMQKFRKKQDSIITMLENKVGDVFDAIYTRCSYKNDNTVIDYSQIYDDFGIREDEIESKIAVIWPLNMELEEVKERDREELLFFDNTQNYPFKNISAQWIPIHKGPYGNPIAILITSFSTMSSKTSTFGKISKFLNLMLNVFEEEWSKDSNDDSNSWSDGEKQFSFVNWFKSLQNMIISKHVNVKNALFTTNKISQAVSKKVVKEEGIEKFRESKHFTYNSQKDKEETPRKLDINLMLFTIEVSNAYINLKNQNVHTLRHINQYYNDFYYEIMEKEEEDLESKQSCNIIEVEITHRNKKPKDDSSCDYR